MLDQLRAPSENGQKATGPTRANGVSERGASRARVRASEAMREYGRDGREFTLRTDRPFGPVLPEIGDFRSGF